MFAPHAAMPALNSGIGKIQLLKAWLLSPSHRLIRGNMILISAVFIIGLFFYGCSNQGAAGVGFSMPPMPVEVSPVILQTIEDRFEAIGTIEALESITVVSEIDAMITSIPFDEGADIGKGALIVSLDDAQLAAELSRAEALLAQSQTTYNRIKILVDENAGRQQDLDDALAGLKVAEANLAFARARHAKTRITAPFGGLIGARRVSTGAFLRSGQPIADLANIDEIRVNFSAPERFLSQLHAGATVNVSSSAFPGYELPGKIIVIEPLIDQATRSARVVASLHNSGRKFRPGMSANISAVLNQQTDALTIPNEAIFGNGNQLFAFVVKPDSTVTQTPLTLGIRLADVTQVLEGLQPGMSVVRAGHQKLMEGGKVLPMSSRTATNNGSMEQGG